MAKLGTYYGLCPLIDSQSLLGIAEDFEKGVVVVTLGKNIASRYKLSDQKPIDSWRTKEKFSSPVIYDKKNAKFVAVFNQSYIKMWTADEDNLDKIKKYKFNQPIHTLISNTEDTFVLFQNGTIHTLENALATRKSLNSEKVISDDGQIETILCRKVNDHFYIGIIVKSDQCDLYWTLCSGTTSKFSRVRLTREEYELKGSVFHIIGDSIHLLTVWSDGKIFTCPLINTDLETSSPGELFTVVESISTKYPISVQSLDENYISMYGANYNEEGAIIIIYNTQFKVIQSKQPFKLFTKDAKLWRIDTNLFLPVGQHLAVIPFCLEVEQLAALVGSHSNLQNDVDISIVEKFQMGCWKDKQKIEEKIVPAGIETKIKELAEQGLPESMMIENILPEVLNNADVDSLALYIKYFFDIPERYLANILKFLVASENKIFSNKKHSSELLPNKLQPLQRVQLINEVFCKKFNEVAILPYLRCELDLNNVLLLIEYICFLMSEEGHLLPSLTTIKTDAKLLDWGCILIDSNYQKLLLCKDNSVSDVLNRFSDIVHEHLQCLQDLNVITPLLRHIKQRKNVNKNTSLIALKYSIEQLSLY